MELPKPTATSLDLTEACNLACDYCFTWSNHKRRVLSYDMATRIIDWWVPQKSVAQLFAFVELEKQQVWIIKNTEMESLAQQKPTGRYHFFMVIDPEAKDRKDKKKFRLFEFEKYKLENRLHSIFC